MRGKLGVRHLDRDNTGQTFPGVIPGGRHLGLLGQPFAFNIAVQAAGEGGAKACKVGTTVPLRDIVGVAVDILCKGIIPLQGDFHANAVVCIQLEVERFVDRSLVVVQIVDESPQTTFILVVLLATRAFVLEVYIDSGIEKCQLPYSLCQLVKVKLNVGKGLGGGPEPDSGARTVGFTDDGQRSLRHTMDIELFIALAFPADSECQLLGEGINH